MSGKKMVLLLIIVLIGTFSNCTDNDCLLTFEEFAPGETPYLYITGREDNCTYTFYGIFWANGVQLWGNGELYYKENGFILESDSLGLHNVKYFDFARRVGEHYEIEFDSLSVNRRGATFAGYIERKIVDNERGEIFVFNVQDGYYMEGLRGDLVFLVSKKSGILGSYIKRLDNGQSVIIAPRGDILEGLIDYSGVEFRTVK